jgi:hypothetical protein
MLLAASGAPVAVKRRAVEPVNKVKTHCICKAISYIMGMSNDDRGLIVTDEVRTKLRRTE